MDGKIKIVKPPSINKFEVNIVFFAFVLYNLHVAMVDEIMYFSYFN